MLNVSVMLSTYTNTDYSNLLPDWMDAKANKQAWDSIAKELEKIVPGSVSKALE
jgi:hypothetical protein